MKSLPLLITLSFLLFGCLSTSKLTKVSTGHNLNANSAEVEDVDIVDWTVGKKAFKISRGFKVGLSIPIISSKDIKRLEKDYQIDSGLIQIRREIRGTVIPVGSMIIPLNYLKKGKAKELYFNVVYYSASIRPKFTQYECVPFNMSYRINDINIRKNPTRKENMRISAYEYKSYKDVILPFMFQNQTFTAGKYLKGEYTFRFAFYNKSESRLRSSFYEYPQKITVDAEEKVTVPGCEMYQGDGKLKKTGPFKWKR